MALGQTSPDDAEQIYLGDQPCRPLSTPRQATRADTPLLPGAPDGTKGPSDRLLLVTSRREGPSPAHAGLGGSLVSWFPQQERKIYRLTLLTGTPPCLYLGG